MTTTRDTADHAEMARLAEDKANAHIRNLRLAASRDFAVSGYSDGLIVEQDMRGMLLAAADAFDAILSEIAALRGEVERVEADRIRTVDDRMTWTRRTLQAERQRDEAVGLLREVCIIQNNGDLDARIFRLLASQGADQ